MKVGRTAFLSVALAALSGAAFAADLGTVEYNQCVFAADSDILTLSEPEVEASVSSFYSEAADAVTDLKVVGSRSPAFVWAVEAKVQCGIASGYFLGGHLDEDSVQKCDCAHGRLVAYR